MSNITQDLFAAIDTIVQKRINEMSFDTTIVGEIKEKKTDHYIVQHGNTAYIAYALNNESYLVGDQVYITIPQGDYNAKKIIVGKVSDNEKIVDQSFLWPVDSIVDIDNQDITMENSKGAYRPQNINNSLLGTRVLGVKATFQTNLPDASSENSYGLAFSINGQVFGVLDSSEFYNNPFMYLNGYTVEKVIELPYSTSWPNITVQFYKRLDNPADSENVNCTHLNLTLGLKTLVDEENKEITAPKLKLYLNDDQSIDYFSSTTNITKTINSIFIENKKGYYTGKSLPSDYEIKYFEYKSGYGTDDILAGPNWKLLKIDSLMSNIEYTIGTDDRITQRNEYRVKAIVKNNETLVAEDIIVFKNIDGGKTDETLGQPNNNDLLIAINGDINHNGVFNVYDSKNCYADDLSKQVINFKVVYADGSSIGKNDIIEWTFPQDLNQLSIALPTEKPYGQQSYTASLNPYYTPGERDTIIKCKVIKDGITYYASKILFFGYKQSQGTSYRLNVKIYRNEQITRNIMYGWDDTLVLSPEVRDQWGNVLSNCTFEFSWVHTIPEYTLVGGKYKHWHMNSREDSKSSSITLSDKTNPEGGQNPTGNQHSDYLGCPIVKIQTKDSIALDSGLEVKLETYVPIIWAIDEDFVDAYMDGATDIVIGQMGGYTYNNEEYKIYNAPEANNLEPFIITSKNNQKTEHSALKITQDKKRIKIKEQLTPLMNAILTWRSKNNHNWVVWRQPMLITQSGYENDILNSWNGAQKIDSANNYILSSMLGAGTKNDDNQFTGFMMGKARFETQDKIGLFGFKEGKRTFEVDENGNAYFEGEIIATRLTLEDQSTEYLQNWLSENYTPPEQDLTGYYRIGNKLCSEDDVDDLSEDATYFEVDARGLLTARNAVIGGKIYAGSGEIAGWTMGTFEDLYTYNNALYSDAGQYRVFLRSNSSVGEVAFGVKRYEDASNKKDYKYTFCVQNDGKMKATYGDIAGWNIGEFTDEEGTYTGSLSKEAGGYRVFLRSDCDKDEKENPLLNSVAIGVKKYDPATQKGEYQFYVDHKGTLFAQDAIIHGKIIANKGGRIGGWQLTDGETGYLHSTGTYPLYLFGNGDGTAMINGNQIENLTFRVGNTGKNADNTWKNTDTATFGITTDGKVYAGEGNIAGWTMGTFEDINTYNNSLYSDAGDYRVFLRSNSSPGQVAFGVKKYENGSNKKDYNYTFCVQNNGFMKATYGNIGGWDINSSRIGSWMGDSATAQTKKAIYIASAKDASDHWIRAYGETENDVTFSVSKTGILTATNADITGIIRATTLYLGETGQTTVENYVDNAAAGATANALKEGKSTFYYSDTNIVRGTPKEGSYGFSVDTKGLLTASNAVIFGTIHAGAGDIAGWNINSKRIGSWTGNSATATTKSAIYIASAKDDSRYWLRAYDSSGSIVFGVSKTGHLTATGATITGILNANAGRIGGWSIAGNEDGHFYSTAGTDAKNIYFYGKGNGRVIIDDDTTLTNFVMRVGPANAMTFGITTDGKVYANKGDIAGWNFDSYKMYNVKTEWSTGLSTTPNDGDPAFWAGYTGSGSTPWNADEDRGWAIDTKFYVTNTGFLKATNAEIEGKITANQGGNIGGWIIDAGQNYIKSNDDSVWLNGDGLGSYNGDSDVGKMIGLNSNDFTRSNAVLRLGASPSKAKFILTNDGQIYATAGTIASLKLENNALYTSYQKGIDSEYDGDKLRDDKQGGFGAEGLFYYSYNYKNDSLDDQTKFSVSIQNLISFILKVENKVWGRDGSDFVEINKHIN